MDEAVIKTSLIELNQTITSFQVSGQRVAGGTYESDCPAPDLQESLDQLRVQIKYLLFDVEATRRENRYLRQLLENRHKNGHDEPKEF